MPATDLTKGCDPLVKKPPAPLPLGPGRDPLAGLEDHPLFRDLPDASQQADAQALRLAYLRLRRAEKQVAQLQEHLAATEQEKRRLLRQIDELELRLAAIDHGTRAVSQTDLQSFEALFTGELPSTKITFNNIPLELKAFLTATKAAFQAEAGVQLTERDQVVCALAALRLIMDTYPDKASIVAALPQHSGTYLSGRLCSFILANLATQIGADSECK